MTGISPSASSTSRRTVGRSFGFLVALAVAIGLLGAPIGRVGPVGPLEVRAATPDLTIVSNATYDVQPDDRRVRVTIDLTLVNHLKDTKTKRFYFDEAFLAVLPQASGYKLTWGGSGKPERPRDQVDQAVHDAAPRPAEAAVQRQDREVPAAVRPQGHRAASRPATCASATRWSRSRSGRTPPTRRRGARSASASRRASTSRSRRATSPPPRPILRAGRSSPPASSASPSPSSPISSATGPGSYKATPLTVDVGNDSAELILRSWPDDARLVQARRRPARAGACRSSATRSVSRGRTTGR